MNWDAVGAIGEIVGALSVLITLVYLTTQIKLSNRIAVAANEAQIQNNFSAINESIYTDTELAALIKRAEGKEPNFTEVENLQVEAWTRRLGNQWLSIEAAHKNGMVSEQTYKLMFNDIEYAISIGPGLHPQWETMLNAYPTINDTAVCQFMVKMLKQMD